MQFTTWFTIFPIALLSLIPAANAQNIDALEMLFSQPNLGDEYYLGQKSEVKWLVATGGLDLSGVTGTIILMTVQGDEYTLATNVPLLDNTCAIQYPPDGSAPPETDNYLIYFQTPIKDFWSQTFTLLA